MLKTSAYPRRLLEAALVVGAFAFVVDGVLGWRKTRRDRRQYTEALHTWEGEGGTPADVPPTATPRQDA